MTARQILNEFFLFRDMVKLCFGSPPPTQLLMDRR
jgi:hypothetical protein